jgi:hypothetical protein
MAEDKRTKPVPNQFHQDLLEEVLLRPAPGEQWYETVTQGMADELLKRRPEASTEKRPKRS